MEALLVSKDTISMEEYEGNLTLYIISVLGKRSIEVDTLYPLTIIYCVFAVIGLCGNLATVSVILSNKYMRNPTNLYLLNLAFSDIGTILIALPIEVFLMWQQYPWPFGEFACDARVVLTETFTNVSILSIVGFTLERYFAICKATSFLSRYSAKNTQKILSLIWFLGFATACPWVFFAKVNYLTYHGTVLEESSWCSIPFNEGSANSLYMMLLSTVTYFLAPFVILVFLYIRILLCLHQNLKVSTSEPLCQTSRSPFHAQRLMFVMVTLQGGWSPRLVSAQHVLFMISGSFYYFNSIVNPIVYSIMSKRCCPYDLPNTHLHIAGSDVAFLTSDSD